MGESLMKRAAFFGVAASIFAIASAATGVAQGDYPSRAAHIVVPFPAGGTTDILTRVIADQLSTALKAPFNVVNKPGAGSNIGAAFVADSAPVRSQPLLLP